MTKWGRHAFFAPILMLAALGLHAAPGSAPSGPPIGKLFVVEVNGSATIHEKGDGPILELVPKAVFKAEGCTIQTSPGGSVSLLFSNGSSMTCSSNTRISIIKFAQASINGPITNLDKEPSVSQVQIFVEKGTIAITTPVLSPGSSQIIYSAQGQINVRDGQVAVNVSSNQTDVSIISGNATAQSLTLGGGSLLQTGFQAVLSNSAPGTSNPILVLPIPTAQLASINELVSEATMARKTVMFAPVPSTGSASSSSSAGSSSSSSSGSKGPSQESQSIFNTGNEQPAQDLQPVPLVPVNLPIQYTVSPARIAQ